MIICALNKIEPKLPRLVSASKSAVGNSNIEITPNSSLLKGSDAVANKLFPSLQATALTALFIRYIYTL
jgi:hypothetical protein